MLNAVRTLAVTAAVGLCVTAAPAAAMTAATSPPSVTMAISDSTSTVKGALTQKAGPITFVVKALGSEAHQLMVFQLKSGYTTKRLQADARTLRKDFESDNHTDVYFYAYRRMEKYVVGLGGAFADPGSRAKATVVLPKGTFYLSDNLGDGFGRLRKLTVTTATNGATMPKPAGTVVLDNEVISGAKVLPARGTIRIRNTTPQGKHWLALAFQRVQPGTTEQQFQDLAGGLSDDSSFLLPGSAGGDILSPGRNQLLNYTLEPGTYALYNPLPHPAHSGYTYASQGMVRIVTVR